MAERVSTAILARRYIPSADDEIDYVCDAIRILSIDDPPSQAFRMTVYADNVAYFSKSMYFLYCGENMQFKC